MSSNTNNLRAILLHYRSLIADLVEDRHDRGITTEQLVAVDDEAIAAVLALLPPLEKITEADKQDANWTDRAIKATRNNTIRETRRNLIGEQL